ncbi:GFA family protein [Vibrio sp.]|uniref:GFA family protein n=1 Tax=Vibrio viridaestus TaxID=2487322 RepID=A0A3N9TKM8_9VIBR|nr:GFA family protein [Vibrio viridaestus]MDC0612050.1 GFA family protein [Vibrio sp.]RQW64820.1 GFA family protein [Vibrio viridaestus]
MQLYKASCLCGKITFSVGGFSLSAPHCHCSMCRKFHGAAFGTLVEVKSLNWISGKESLAEYQAPNGTIRTFCSHCGSSIGFRGKGISQENMEVAIALFDDNIPVKPSGHIYTHYKANWYDINDDLPRYDEGK